MSKWARAGELAGGLGAVEYEVGGDLWVGCAHGVQRELRVGSEGSSMVWRPGGDSCGMGRNTLGLCSRPELPKPLEPPSDQALLITSPFPLPRVTRGCPWLESWALPPHLRGGQGPSSVASDQGCHQSLLGDEGELLNREAGEPLGWWHLPTRWGRGSCTQDSRPRPVDLAIWTLLSFLYNKTALY